MLSTEYVALVGSFFLVGLEALIRVLTLALRKDISSWAKSGLIILTGAKASSLLDLFYAISRRLFNKWRSPAQKRAEERRKCS